MACELDIVFTTSPNILWCFWKIVVAEAHKFCPSSRCVGCGWLTRDRHRKTGCVGVGLGSRNVYMAPNILLVLLGENFTGHGYAVAPFSRANAHRANVFRRLCHSRYVITVYACFWHIFAAVSSQFQIYLRAELYLYREIQANSRQLEPYNIHRQNAPGKCEHLAFVGGSEVLLEIK